jgi:predicted dehydrogenase
MPVKICLIGAGHMGRIHAQKLTRMNDIRLVGVVDPDRKQVYQTAQRHGVPGYDKIAPLLEQNLDGAIVASPTKTHFPIARLLLENGISVFLEKPIAATPAEAEHLVVLARNKNLVLQIGHLERFNPPFRRALPLIDSPIWIEAKRTSGFTGRSTDIDVIYDLMIHDIDLVLSINDSGVTGLAARGTKVLTGKIDVAMARIDFSDGCAATLTASRVSGSKERSLEIVQQNRYISLNLAEGRMLFVDGTKGKRRSRLYTASSPDPVRDELRAFVRAVKGKGGVLVSGEDGLRALVLADAIKEEIEQRIANERARAGA